MMFEKPDNSDEKTSSKLNEGKLEEKELEPSNSPDENITSELNAGKLEGKKFERKIEEFTCDNCELFVQGNGYTDHCPSCLYSKHVDINPGDRNCSCCGIMKPVAAEVKKDGYKIHYDCQSCGHKHKVKSSPDDNFEVILKLIGEPY